jgi:hypothetical protein
MVKRDDETEVLTLLLLEIINTEMNCLFIQKERLRKDSSSSPFTWWAGRKEDLDNVPSSEPDVQTSAGPFGYCPILRKVMGEGESGIPTLLL